MHRFLVVAVVASVWALAVAGCGGSGAQPTTAEPTQAMSTPTPQSPAVQPLDDASTAVRLQATIYEIRIAPEKLAELDAARLAKVDFSKYPPELGESRSLYLFDQEVSLAGDQVMVGGEEPIVTNSRITGRGQQINNVEYRSVGAVVDFKAERTGPRKLQVSSTIEMSTRTDGPVEMSNGVATPVVRRTMMSLKGPVELGNPTVLISGDGTTRDKDGKAVVYLARIVLGAGAAGAN